MADRPTPPRRHLSVEERQVLTHLPRARSLDQVAHLAGLPAERVREVLSGLVEEGVIKLGARGMPTLSARTLPAARRTAPAAGGVRGLVSPPQVSPPPPQVSEVSSEVSDTSGRRAPDTTTLEIALSEAEVSNTDAGQAAGRAPAQVSAPAPAQVSDVSAEAAEVSEVSDTSGRDTSGRPPAGPGPSKVSDTSTGDTSTGVSEVSSAASSKVSDTSEGAASSKVSDTSEGTPPRASEGVSDTSEGDTSVSDSADTSSEPTEQAVGGWRALFERQLHPLPEDQRVARARHAEEPELSALCFDPLPSVVKALLENVRLGPVHARLVARHHRNPVGLEALCARAALAQDVGVRRWLVRNPQLPASLLRRLWAGRRLLEQYLVAQDRDVPEPTRRTARELLRTRFSAASAEERVELILKTEGRVLAWLVGLAVDQKTSSLLCGRPYRSVLLVQNLARWSAAPPTLVAWLLRQEVVRRQPQLRQLLLRHPNAPTEARRGQQ